MTPVPIPSLILFFLAAGTLNRGGWRVATLRRRLPRRRLRPEQQQQQLRTTPSTEEALANAHLLWLLARVPVLVSALGQLEARYYRMGPGLITGHACRRHAAGDVRNVPLRDLPAVSTVHINNPVKPWSLSSL
jgi:hypothetical protein